jgi:hypothetical protein
MVIGEAFSKKTRTTPPPGEIHLAAFPFGDAPGMKLRPVLLLTPRIASPNEILVAYISCVVPPRARPTDIVLDPQLDDHRQTIGRTAHGEQAHTCCRRSVRCGASLCY